MSVDKPIERYDDESQPDLGHGQMGDMVGQPARAKSLGDTGQADAKDLDAAIGDQPLTIGPDDGRARHGLGETVRGQGTSHGVQGQGRGEGERGQGMPDYRGP